MPSSATTSPELEGLETASLVNLYTLLSDVQRDADDFRGDVADVLLDRVHHDQPVHRQFGSVQRTGRTYRSLRDEEEILETLEEAGIPHERVTSVGSTKVDEALEVTEVAPTDVYEIEEREYVRKAEVDEAEKETQLQGLKDRLAATEGDEAGSYATRSRSWRDASTTSRASDPVRRYKTTAYRFRVSLSGI